MFLQTTLLNILLAARTLALPSESIAKKAVTASFPFTRMVAFGDNLSDNGNGSFAHCLANPGKCNDRIYGYKTWTNGPVAVSYLSDLIGVPLTDDYAFGGAYGGSKIGATISNNYTSSAYAPDAFQQVDEYLNSDGVASQISSTLHFVWIGNNDITLKHIFPGQKNNPAFANDMADQMESLIQRLVDAGAQYIFVPAIYPKHVAPFRKYLASNQAGWDNVGRAISQANTAIAQRLRTTFGQKVLTYDAFNFMLNIFNNAADFGLQYTLPEYCDGYSQKYFNLCVVQGHGELFYWMQFTDMTTSIHSLLAGDMAVAIRQSYV